MTQMPTLSIFTASVGFHSSGHTLPSKLRSIANAGFEAVEIFQDDLDAFAASDEFAIIYKALTPPSSPQIGKRVLTSTTTTATIASTSSNTLSDDKAIEQQQEEKTAWNAHGQCTPFEAQREIVCASYIRGICASLGLQILSLQPMRDIEGWKDTKKRKDAIERVRSRFPVMRALGTDLLLCCSNCQSTDQITNDINRCVEDFTILSDEAERFETCNELTPSQQQSLKPLKIAFEGLSWGTYIDRWDQAYTIVEKVNRNNFGLCFDSFNTLGRQFADPCSSTGIQEPREETEKALQKSLQAILQVPAEKIFFLQVGDAKKLENPLEPSPNPKEPRPARMIWSRGNRLYPGEFDRGAFMPTLDFVNAVYSTGYKGPWSIEVFNSSLHQPGVEVQKEHAERGYKGLVWLINQVIKA